ncbi:MAG: ABC-2 family transporter protein [bacterium]|nr:ABC-2 family transporter protein [bacterium]
MSGLGAITRAAALRRAAYRVDYWMGLGSLAVMLSVQYHLWRAVHAGAGSLAGLGLPQLLTYVLLARVVASAVQVDVDANLGYRMRLGDLVHELCRPVDWQAALLAESLGQQGFTLLGTSLPAYLICRRVGLVLPPAPGATGWFLAGLVLSYLLMFGLAFLVGAAALRFRSVRGLIDLKLAVILFFSGGLVPLDLYPAWLGRIAAWLPFQGIYHLPVSLYLGRVANPADALALQAGWVLAVVTAGRLAWLGLRRHLVIQGG